MATPTATVLVDPRRITGPIDQRVYGQFLENMGRAIYGGVFEPGSPLADADGYRTDVLGAARELAPTVLRWPGGNFALRSTVFSARAVGPTMPMASATIPLRRMMVCVSIGIPP